MHVWAQNSCLVVLAFVMPRVSHGVVGRAQIAKTCRRARPPPARYTATVLDRIARWQLSLSLSSLSLSLSKYHYLSTFECTCLNTVSCIPWFSRYTGHYQIRKMIPWMGSHEHAQAVFWLILSDRFFRSVSLHNACRVAIKLLLTSMFACTHRHIHGGRSTSTFATMHPYMLLSDSPVMGRREWPFYGLKCL
jgi:hypothetical protein